MQRSSGSSVAPSPSVSLSLSDSCGIKTESSLKPSGTFTENPPPPIFSYTHFINKLLMTRMAKFVKTVGRHLLKANPGLLVQLLLPFNCFSLRIEELDVVAAGAEPKQTPQGSSYTNIYCTAVIIAASVFPSYIQLTCYLETVQLCKWGFRLCWE